MRFIRFFIPAILFCVLSLHAQVVIKELPGNNAAIYDSVSAGISRTRGLILLDGRWDAFISDNKNKQVSITVPSTFKGVDELTFEKSFTLTEDQVNKNRLQLCFEGISHSAEIIVNNYVIYKHPGGEFPFKIALPKDILSPKKRNILSVKVNHTFHSEITIPANPRFLFPELPGGIFRDVYIKLLPLVSISNIDIKNNVSPGRAQISLNVKFENNFGDNKPDTSAGNNEYAYRMRLISPAGSEALSYTSPVFVLSSHKDKSINQSLDLSYPELWTPYSPKSYKLSVQLLKGEQVIDEENKPVCFYSLKAENDSLYFNGHGFILDGTTYYPSNQNYGTLASYTRMEEDIKIIKGMGFTAVRFAKCPPHPYYLDLCRKYGLLAFIEIPINSLPLEISDKESYKERARSYLLQFLSGYKNYSAVAGIGLGSSYLSGDDEQVNFLSDLADNVKKITNKLVYATFTGFNINPVRNIDLYGIEIFNKPVEEYMTSYINLEKKLGKGKVFIGEATYPTYMGSTNGYLNPYSFEAQAKSIGDLIDFVIENRASGYFINSAFDYRGAFISLVSGYDPDNVYHVGILGEDRELNRLSQKVIYSKLNEGDKVTIPIGNRKEDIPIIFIISAVALGLIMGFLINSRRKFREDATRALLRPYNFFADIRDNRLFSLFQANILMLILSVCSALLQVNLLYFLRSNVFVEKLLLSFGSTWLLKVVSYLAWNPNEALAWLTLVSIGFFIVFSILVKIASFFVRNKVFFSSIYYSIVWSFLPLILLLPLGLILYKILSVDIINLYLLISLVVFTLWIYYRVMKGIYVIFDVNPGRVYFYSLAAIILFIGCILIYYQLNESTIHYIVNAYRQYNLI